MENREIPSGWRETTLGEVAEYINRGITPKYTENGIVVLNQRCIREGKILFENSRLTDSKSKKISDEKILKDYDILICSTGVGTLGRVSQIKKINEQITIDSHVTVVRVKSKINNQYIGWYLRSKEREIEAMAEGTTGQTELPRKKLNDFIVLMPTSYEEQKAIADVLSSLDEKIELLEEENKTLETLAQTIFTEWFVNFNFPGATGEMEDSELGEIPKGWRVGKLEEVCQIKNGFAFKSEDYEIEGIPVVRTTNFDNGTIVMNNPVFLSEEKAKEYSNYFLEEFDFLLVMVGASIGKNVLVPSYILPALQNQNMWNFKSIIKEYRFYNIFLFKELIMKHSNSASGSAREFFRKDFFYNIDIVIPSEDILVKFGETVENLFRKMNINITQIQTLKSTRDILLPKLMSGEIRVEGFGG